MPVFPNSVSYDFCTWMLATPWLEITNPQRLIIIDVQTAAAGSLSVTDNTWNNFLMSTWEHYKAYQSYIDQITTYAAPWTTYGLLSTIIGFSAFTAQEIYYYRSGRILSVLFNLVGTSNANNLTFTLPFASSAAPTRNRGYVHTLNAGGPATSGVWINSAGSNVITVYPAAALSAWNVVGAKEATGQFTLAVG